MIKIFGLVFILFLFLFLYIWHTFRQKIYVHVSANTKLEKEYSYLPKTSIQLTTSDNINISGWYIKANNPKAVVILVHGYLPKNGGKALMLPHADYLYKNRYSTILIDTRSVAESQISKISLGINEYKDVEAAYEYAKTLPENKDIKIGYLGISAGASTAIITNGVTNKGDFIIASVPFSSFNNLYKTQLIKAKLPTFLSVFLNIASLIEYGFNYQNYSPINQAKNITAPILLISAKNDTEVNPKDVQDLYKELGASAQIWNTNKSHDVYAEYKKEFEEKILKFLNIQTSK